MAAKTGDVKVLHILRRYSLKGLDITQKTTDGLTAIDIAEALNDVDQAWITAFGELLESIEDRNGQCSKAANLDKLDEDDDAVFVDAFEYQEIS